MQECLILGQNTTFKFKILSLGHMWNDLMGWLNAWVWSELENTSPVLNFEGGGSDRRCFPFVRSFELFLSWSLKRKRKEKICLWEIIKSNVETSPKSVKFTILGIHQCRVHDVSGRPSHFQVGLDWRQIHTENMRTDLKCELKHNFSKMDLTSASVLQHRCRQLIIKPVFKNP